MDFDSLKIRLDPWQSDYGGELLAEPPVPETEETVRLDVETDGEWAPIAPRGPRDEPGRLLFVDGVRRIDARLVARRDGGEVVHGVAASFAVGAVLLGDGAARFEAEDVHRLLVLGSGEHSEPLRIGPGLEYRPLSVTDDERDDPSLGLQRAMQAAEAALVAELARRHGRGHDHDSLVIADGPLRFEGPVPEGTVGYVKRAAKLHLPASHLGVLARLGRGERTPLFALGIGRRGSSGGSFARLAWYLRLAAPRPGETDLAGLARLEVAEGLGTDAARRLADATCRFLPPLGSRPFEDPRAPQNLVPVGALERRLTRALGDRRLVRRWLEEKLARQALAENSADEMMAR